MSSNSEAVHEQKSAELNDRSQQSPQQQESQQQTYQQQHKSSSEFESREEYLENELKIMAPKRWRPATAFVSSHGQG